MQGSSYVVPTCDHRAQAAVVRASRPRAANTAKGRESRTLVCWSSNRPLSDYSNDVIRAATERTEQWVNRPADVRWRETEQRHGYIARPLNSFMLYRSAYIPEAKAQYSRSRQQELSAIVGESWRRESQKVRQAYEAYALIERRNHHEAYPEYKFSPKKLTMKKGDTSSEEGPRTTSSNVYSCGDCPLAAAANKDQAWDTTSSPIDADASVRSAAPDAFAAWQPTLLPMQPTLWQDQNGNHAVHYQVVGNNVLWPSVTTPPLFLGPCSVSWEPPMDSTAFPTVPNTNGLPVANPSLSGAEILAGAGVNYTMPAYVPSCCGYPYTLSETDALL
ncbi:hypothetical protein E8E11_005972 [Didymella keratinophila]|nr:hypothetical protein E8E11_005972 [Didymella keratinophila]